MRIAFLHRRDNVILTAVEIIDELGIQGLSTKEIAKRQGISEGTLFRHFRSKNEILLAVLDHFSKYDNDIFATVRQKELAPVASILFVVDTFAAYYESYPAITALTQLNGVLAYETALAGKVKETYAGRLRFLEETIRSGVEQGELVVDDPELLAAAIDGLFLVTLMNWRSSGYGFSLREAVTKGVRMLLTAFAQKPNGGCV